MLYVDLLDDRDFGVSVDKDSAKLKRTIKELQMNWFQYFDKETDISKLYGVTAYPTYFLIDQQGKILYTSNNLNNDESELTKTLGHILK
ncbi:MULTISPECIES: redoxin family protein [unclassified Mucilaginibacter]|uniref:TlpA family protein disulfide reductase n=1 Tax=unclassified Mucilaginibacter TaxID=2617802 RepID=UPI002AC992D5|nr:MULTISPECIES: redoxin family protein [unclassified Mucilaginibacter]MEB0260876.1 redoxin domain-containing protein [Mucilaginibacter sp. 10I4]MEB0279889.1 redoxin domain-containing protein [Mucilaginibacter sp. 10B2]MEB0302850.1 redoxin domain-containing protein [Mucilaginibacter sp. 5C4]WPX24138.1 redoxin domain-containing protein [Mucilaginibacter sp. 5C4]